MQKHFFKFYGIYSGIPLYRHYIPENAKK